MSRKSIIAPVAAAVIAALALGAVALDRAAFGIPSFYVWRALGGEYHGSHRANVNGVSLYYEVYGQGPPVLVLHGAGAFFESMHYFISALAPHHTVIAVDSRGQGRSTDSTAPLSYSLMGDDTIKLLDTLHIAKADVVGWSDGGIIELDMAMKHPGRVRRLVAISANYDISGVNPKQVTPEALAEIVAEIKPIYEAIAPDPSHFPVLMKKIEAMIATEPHYTLADLERIRDPVLIVAGENDLVFRKHTDAMAAAIPGAQEIIVPHATHTGPLEQSETYNAIALKFLDAN